MAIDLLDTSAAFDTLVHLYLLRKMEVEVGMGEDSLEWLESYLKDWLQYVVVGVKPSTVRKTTRGAPQGGGFSPNLFRSYTNTVPEAGLLMNDNDNVREMPGRPLSQDKGFLSKLVDTKEDLGTEDRLDQELRKEGAWDILSWREERTGDLEHDVLKQKIVEEDGDVLTTIYADDTQSRTSAKTLQELERRNGIGLTRICEEMKSLRLKVNEDKTTYLVIATQGRRCREDLKSEIEVSGEKVKSTKTGKCLGLIITDDLTWRDQVDKVVKSCNSKQSGLWKCTALLRQDQRKAKAEGIILSRLGYCLKVISQGRKTDLERLQSVQSKAARWILQTRRQEWSLTGGLRKLGWLSMAQQAAYTSIKLAMQIVKDSKPERLYNILTEEKEGARHIRSVNENKFKKLKATTRKSWSNRSLRWLEQMPIMLKSKDIALKSTKTALKSWVKHHVPVRGDRILWGRPLSGDMRRKKKGNQRQEDEDDQSEHRVPVQGVVDTTQEGETNILDTSERGHEEEQAGLEVNTTEAGTVMKVGGLKVKWWKLWLIAMLIMNLNGNTRLQLTRREVPGNKSKRRGVVSLPEVSSGWCSRLVEARTGVG